MSVKPVPNPDEGAAAAVGAQTPMMSPKRDIQRLRQNTAAVAGELKEFLGRMKGRSAAERLGIIASSNLVRSTLAAMVVFAILIGALTAGPFFWKKMKKDDVAGPEVAATEPGEENPNGEPAEEPAEDPNVKTGQPGEVSLDPDEINNALGTGGTATPPKNPLESSGDDLLDIDNLDN